MLIYYCSMPEQYHFKQFAYKNITFYVMPFTFYKPDGTILVADRPHSGCNCGILNSIKATEDFEKIEPDETLKTAVNTLFSIDKLNCVFFAYFHMYTPHVMNIVQELQNYHYFELRYTDLYGFDLYSFDILGHDDTTLTCIGFGDVNYKESDTKNVLEIVTPNGVKEFDVTIPFVTTSKAFTNFEP